MKSYYFLQRSKPHQEKDKRGLAVALLLVVVIFAVIMHLPKPKPDTTVHALKPKPLPTVVVPAVRTVTVEQKMPYGTTTIDSPSLPAGTTKITQPGVFGIWTMTYQITTINGKDSPRRLVNIATTKNAVNEIITRGTGQ